MEAMDRLLERCRELTCEDEEGGTPDMEHRDTTTIEEIQENDLEQMTRDLTDKNGSRPGDHLIEEPPGEAIERLLESCRTSGDHNGKGHSTDQDTGIPAESQGRANLLGVTRPLPHVCEHTPPRECAAHIGVNAADFPTYSLESRKQNKNNLDRHFGNEEPEDEISLTTCGLVDPPFSENEVKLTAFKFGKRKSPGPEGIDNTVVKALLRMNPSLLARFFNSLVRDFLRDRRISLSFGGRKLERNCARGCPQGSCCGPIMWNILVNTVFQEELPEGAWLVLYADDQFLIIEAASRAKAEKCVEASLQILSNWAHDSGLKFNVSKTKALSIKPRDIRTKRKGIKWEHKDERTEDSVQRTAALRILGGYRTTSSEAFLVLAGLIPLGLKLEEETIRQKIWENREDALGLEAGALEWKRDPRKPPQWLPNKSGTNTGAGVVIFTNGELIFQESLTLRVDELVFSAELVAIRVALRVCAEKNFSPDRLYSDCMSVLVAINLVKGQLAHQIIQELEMITRAPEG
ncbi:hypothetical protein LAZ67_X000718 [Cordylochernes scorpioides]|uniref:Reverse transcriptase domain-containing protein n=1 Tax=Cordylochernes scorpioides TaxID=51811 RepID=A0ABY6LRW2_9ARAC|nr:hypothetical protein LAZ67_X000718 [Cordylochernes scorpioides]